MDKKYNGKEMAKGSRFISYLKTMSDENLKR